MTKSFEPQERWDNFWKDILVLPDGSLDIEQLKKELADFSELIHNVPLVYMDATGGMVSKPLTDVNVVCSLIQEYVSQKCAEAVEDYKEEYNV